MSRISIYSVYTSTYKRDVGCCCFFCIAVHLFNVSIVKKKKKNSSRKFFISSGETKMQEN